MRFETHRVSEAVVRMLQASPAVREVLVDGGDIIECLLASGATVSLHLIESNLSLHEARLTLQANNERGVHTLLIFWRDLLLPDHNQDVPADPWLAAWRDLYGGKVYGYDLDGADIFLFPVHLEPIGANWKARFGRAVDMGRLAAHEVRVAGGPLTGLWRVAAFDGDAVLPEIEGLPRSIAECYALLEIEPDASQLRVKRAYRRMARRLHPDISAAADATARMQALNEAYEALLRHLDARSD